MLNPVHLRTLAAVLSSGSFADAARRLGYTASAVSQQIAALEQSVRMPLFERDSHSVRPTSTAEFLSLRSFDALALLDALEDDVRAMAAGTFGRLRLGGFPTANEQILPKTLLLLTLAGANFEVHLDEGEPNELAHLLSGREIDLAIVYRYDLVPRQWSKELRSVPLLDEKLFLLLPTGHRFAGRAVELADLRGETWISTRDSSAGASLLRRVCAQAGFEPIVDYRSNDYGVIRGLVRSGLGIGFVPALGHIASDGVEAILVNGFSVCRHVLALRRSGKPDEAVTRAIDAMVMAAETIASSMPGVDLTSPKSM